MRAVLAVSEEEQVRRVAVVKAREDAATAAARDIVAQIPAHRLAYLKEVCKHSGLRNAKQWFRNEDDIASKGIDKGTADAVLSGLETFEHAEIEEQLARHSMCNARDILDRVARA